MPSGSSRRVRRPKDSALWRKSCSPPAFSRTHRFCNSPPCPGFFECMKTALLLWTALIFSALAEQPASKEEPIDWARAQTLHQRAQRGDKLAPDDQTYYAAPRQPALGSSLGLVLCRSRRKDSSRSPTCRRTPGIKARTAAFTAVERTPRRRSTRRPHELHWRRCSRSTRPGSHLRKDGSFSSPSVCQTRLRSSPRSTASPTRIPGNRPH